MMANLHIVKVEETKAERNFLSNCQRHAPQNDRALHVVCLAFHLPSKSLIFTGKKTETLKSVCPQWSLLSGGI